MNNSKEITIKEEKKLGIEDKENKDKKHDIKIKEQTVSLDKWEKDGKATVKVSIREHKDKDDDEGYDEKSVEATLKEGFISDYLEIDEVDNKKLKEPVSIGLKGIGTVNIKFWITIGAVSIAILGFI